MRTAASILDAHTAAAGGAAAVVQRAKRKAPDGDAPLVRRLEYELADQLPVDEEDFDDELIEGVIGRMAMGVLYGDSNSGKTFLAIDMAASVARGVDWLCRPTAGGLVIYLATEAPESVKRRLRAYQKHHAVRAPGFVIVKSPINLYDGDADVTAVLAMIGEIESLLGGKVALVVADTLARISAGANENSGEDMGVVLKHADTIRAATGVTFLWVHHCGKDQARGMRGWSGMRAAIDTEIEVTSDDATGMRSAEITKQRDLPGKGDRIGFKLALVPLGQNRWGTPRSSCVVEPAEAPAKAVRGKRPSEIAGAITEYLNEHGAGRLRGVVAKHFEGRYARPSVYREIGKMLGAGLLTETAGVVALAGGSTRSKA
jgi:KaiC/GvpD/RAD55 family RecA-like ATPase